MAQRPDDLTDAPESLTRDDPKTVLPVVLNEADQPHHDRDDVSPLLTLELTATEKAGQNSEPREDSNPSNPRNPLLGTTASTGVETLRKSSSRRSPKRQSYGFLPTFTG